MNVMIKDFKQKYDISEVNQQEPFDLSPICLSEFNYSDYTLVFKTPKYLTPELDETKQIICAKESALGIDVFAFTRNELYEALSSDIDVLWRNYALSEDNLLTSEAKQLKQNLLSEIEVKYAMDNQL